MTKVINIRLTEEELKAIEKIAKKKYFGNRSLAIREILKDAIKKGGQK